MVAADVEQLMILYDGVCGLCNRFVQFILKHDKSDIFRFAPLQGRVAGAILERHGIGITSMDTVYLVLDPGQPSERLENRSDATLTVFRHLGGFWRFFSGLFALVPRNMRNAAYDLVARNRYRLFGKFSTCPLPDERTRRKFLGL